jgi:hypothetical protein
MTSALNSAIDAGRLVDLLARMVRCVLENPADQPPNPGNRSTPGAAT